MLDLVPALEGPGGPPAYLQIAAALRRAVASGELGPGERLAPVRQVAQALDINFNTVARAYRLLEGEGLVETHRGRGTFVVEPGASADLGQLVRAFMRRAYQHGFDALEVRWETSNAIRSWLQEGAPLGAEE